MILRHLRRAFLAGLVLVVGTNVVIALGVVRNRLGEPDASLVLSERELALAGAWTQRDEDSGMALHLRVHLNSFRLDRDKLSEIGFDFEAKLPAGRTYRKMLPRRALVVLELEGDSWTRWIAQRETEVREVETRQAGGDATREQLESARRDLERDRVNASRLFVVDVGRDGRALRLRHADRQRYAIVPGVVRSSGYEKTGRVSEVLVRQIHVPHPLRHLVAEAIAERRRRDRRRWQDRQDHEAGLEDLRPVYRATLAFGRRFEPILENVALLDTGSAEPVPAGPGDAADPG